jgi:hypothetical protein
MYKRDEQIGGYRLRQDEGSIVIDERRKFFSAVFDFIFGTAFMFPLILIIGAFLPTGGLFGIKVDYSERRPIWAWLVYLVILCVPVVFFLVGAFDAFARTQVVVTSKAIFTGHKWFWIWPRLKSKPVSEVATVKLEWRLQRGGPFGGGFWVCEVQILPAKSGKSMALLSCHKKEDALKLADCISETTRLSIHDATNS